MPPAPPPARAVAALARADRDRADAAGGRGVEQVDARRVPLTAPPAPPRPFAPRPPLACVPALIDSEGEVARRTLSMLLTVAARAAGAVGGVAADAAVEA